MSWLNAGGVLDKIDMNGDCVSIQICDFEFMCCYGDIIYNNRNTRKDIWRIIILQLRK